MPSVKIKGPPGFAQQGTQVQAGGNWFGGNLMRWRMGELEKMAGWRRLWEDPLTNIIRRLHAWEDIDNHKNMLVATDAGIDLLVNDRKYSLGHQFDLIGGRDTLGIPFGTTMFSATVGSKTVHVGTWVRGEVGETFVFHLPISIGGRILGLNQVFTITGIDGAGWTFEMSNVALYSETDVDGTRVFVNDIPNGMTCTFKNHGLVVGNTFTIEQLTSVIDSSLAPSGVSFTAPPGTVFTVTAVPDVDHFQFSMGAFGTGNNTGANSRIAEGWQINRQVSELYSLGQGSVIGLAARDVLGDPQRQSWFLDNMGKDGLALASGGPLQVYHPPIENGGFLRIVGFTPPPPGPVTAPLPPTTSQLNNGMLVAMPQAQVILFGCEVAPGAGLVDPLLIRWSDVGTYDVYDAAVTNQAGSFRLGRGSRIMGAIQAPQTTLIWTESDLWSMSYIGPPLVYGFTILGSGCGLQAPHDATVFGRTTFWKSRNNFWQYGDTGVQPIPSTVWDYLFKDLDQKNVNKCHVGANSSANEVMFFFPSASSRTPENVNLLLYSELFNQTNKWSMTGAFCPQFGPGPPPLPAPHFGSLLHEFQVNDFHQAQQRIYKDVIHQDYVFSVYALLDPDVNGAIPIAQLRNLSLRAETPSGSVHADFNLTGSGSVIGSGTANNTFTFVSAAVTTDSMATGPSGNKWVRLVMKFQSDDDAILDLIIGLMNGTNYTYMGTDPNFILAGNYIYGAMLNEGSVALPYDQTGATLFQNEPTLYVKFNPVERAWDSGILPRSAWIDNNVFGGPMGGDRNFRIQEHEIGYDDDDQPMRGVYAETGYSAAGDGQLIVQTDYAIPDFKWFGVNGAVNLTFKGKMFPGGKGRSVGPFSMTPTKRWLTPRIRARLLAVRYDWAPVKGFGARVGDTQVQVKMAGRHP